MFTGFVYPRIREEKFWQAINICGLYESEGKAVAFHVMKPCIEFMQGFFFVLIN